VATVPATRPEHVRAAFAKARAFKPAPTRFERQRILQRTAELLRDGKNHLARLIKAESGFRWKDSLYEASRAYDVWAFAAQLTIKDDGEIFACDISPNGKNRKISTMRLPLLGVISAIALADVLYEAGLPPEMLSVVTGNPGTMGDAMITDPDADLATFTGSVRVGKHIAEKAGYERIVLELGGNDPLIVLEDADLDKAADRAVLDATKNSGQRGTAVKRILVVESVADAFVDKVMTWAKALKAGGPMDPDTDVGTVINARSAALFEKRVDDAVAKGALRLHGARRDGALFPPTLFDRVPHDRELVREETFGPVIRSPNDIDAVINISNSTAYGLSSGVCTNRLDYITRCVGDLEVGTVNVWEATSHVGAADRDGRHFHGKHAG
jgi:acyl-CoA reductase-like NAD-dependent aldehyde dehydrogenase